MTEDHRLLTAHRALLTRFRQSMNLVGPGSLDVHFDDARHALDGLQPSGRWVDLGTGAGFPGLVFAALFPEVEVELVDSRSKRCWFLEQVLAEAEREQVVVRCVRHETLERGYDGVLSRALHAPEKMLDVARRLLVPGGKLVLFLQEHAPLPEAEDFSVFHVKHYLLNSKARKSAVLTWAG